MKVEARIFSKQGIWLMEDLIRLVEDVFEIDGTECGEDTVINELENWDSLKYMEFIVTIEERYRVSLTGDEIAGFRTLSDVIKTISTKSVELGK